MQTLISVDELFLGRIERIESIDSIESQDYFLFDCRFSLADETQGEKLYQEGHIADAVYAHLNRDLSSKHIAGKTGRHPLPDKNEWLNTIRSWGVKESDRVIAYDEGAGAFAARLWWMFRWAGHANVAVLDGGLTAWLASGHGVTSAATNKGARKLPAKDSINQQFKLKPSLTRTMAATDLIKNAGKLTLIDARTQERFDGTTEPIDAVAGHIPGAICAPFQDNLNADHKFKTAEELKARFQKLSANNQDSNIDRRTSEENPLVCYCGSGVTAAHNILALVHAGFKEPYLYPGSWSEWITDDHRPVATR